MGVTPQKNSPCTKEWMVTLLKCLMKMSDVNTILRCIKETLCQTLCHDLDSEWVYETDPDEDIPTGSEVIISLQPDNELLRPAVEHIIGLMDDLSTAAAHFSSLRKLVELKIFSMILHTSMRPMVQLNILERVLKPLRETEVDTLRGAILKKVSDKLLPKSKTRPSQGRLIIASQDFHVQSSG